MPARLRDLELRHLVAFDAVSTEGTFAKAAARLGYTQSAVSQQIAALERVVGTALFDRPGGPRPVEPTPAGTMLLAHARDVLSRVEAAGDAVDRFLAGEDNSVRVRTFQSVSNVLLPEIVMRLRAELPGVDLHVVEDECDEDGPARVQAGELDVAFCLRPPPQLESIVLLHDPWVLITRPGDLPPGCVRLTRTIDVPMVGYTMSDCRAATDSELAANGVRPNYVYTTEDNGAMCAMVRAGLGWAIIPRLALDERGLDVHSLSPSLTPRQVCIAWRGDRTLAPATRRLIGIASEVAAELARR